jgi:hypothetical protein
MRARSVWHRVGLALATLSLALYALVVAPHVHAAADNPNTCPIWAAHGPAGASIEPPDVVLPAARCAFVASDALPSDDAPAARAAHAFSARGPPLSIA